MTLHCVEPELHHFENDGTFPNSPLPLLLYRQVVDPRIPGLASALEDLLATHGWGDGWRNGVYPFPHYHSTAHEVLAVYRGRATVQFGGPTVGASVAVSTGDVVVIPAGVCHERLDSSEDFAVIGAYPDGQPCDLIRGDRGQLSRALDTIARVLLPTMDPLYGVKGPLVRYWRN